MNSSNPFESIFVKHKTIKMSSTTTVKTFRFKLSEQIMSEISDFARVHRYDSKDDFKDAWAKWVAENAGSISSEKQRLDSMGFDGDLIKKMYVSARYYFKNKSDVDEAPKKRRKYVTIDKNFIQLIDTYILTAIADGNEDVYKPANCFQGFIEEHNDQTARLVRTLMSDGTLENADIIAKIKKTFKNRYFVITNK
jgi:hypothetical protein